MAANQYRVIPILDDTSLLRPRSRADVSSHEKCGTTGRISLNHSCGEMEAPMRLGIGANHAPREGASVSRKSAMSSGVRPFAFAPQPDRRSRWPLMEDG